MIESPLINELLAESKQEDILQVLKARFGEIPPEVAHRLRRFKNLKKLEGFITLAAQCPDLEAFRACLHS